MRDFKLIGFLGTLLLAAPSALAAAPSGADMTKIECDIRPVVQIKGQPVEPHCLATEMAAHRLPSISLAVVDHGRIVWAKAYGYADVAARTTATPETLYQAASISKAVSASIALRLVEQGRLALDRDINAELTSWKLPASPFTKGHPVTLRGLLSHTAGLSVPGFPGYPPGAPVPSVVEVLEGKSPANTPPVLVTQTPGTKWTYSGGGFTVAQLAMSDVTGLPFPELARRQVLGPLGMSHSTYEQPLPQIWRGQAATGYLDNGDPVAGRFYTYPEMATAGLSTTPSDLAKWAIALARAYNGEPSPLISHAMAQQMLTPRLGDWGLGVSVQGKGGDLRFAHDGVNAGFNSSLTAWPRGERAIIIMGNGVSASAVMAPLAQAIARHYGWSGLEVQIVEATPLSEAQLAELVGSYGKGALVLSVEKGALVAKLGGRDIELVPQSPDHFLVIAGTSPIAVTAERGADGKIKSMTGGGYSFARDP